jgi:hypothetical protein
MSLVLRKLFMNLENISFLIVNLLVDGNGRFCRVDNFDVRRSPSIPPRNIKPISPSTIRQFIPVRKSSLVRCPRCHRSYYDAPLGINIPRNGNLVTNIFNPGCYCSINEGKFQIEGRHLRVLKARRVLRLNPLPAIRIQTRASHSAESRRPRRARCN